MGICISSESSAIHGAPEEARDENVLVFEATKLLRGLSSAYSKQGTKGLNQDAATLCQVHVCYNETISDYFFFSSESYTHYEAREIYCNFSSCFLY